MEEIPQSSINREAKTKNKHTYALHHSLRTPGKQKGDQSYKRGTTTLRAVLKDIRPESEWSMYDTSSEGKIHDDMLYLLVQYYTLLHDCDKIIWGV